MGLIGRPGGQRGMRARRYAGVRIRRSAGLRKGGSRAETSVPRATILGVNTTPPDPLLLVQGDEELLAARAIAAAVDAARAADPGADVREYEAGSLAAGEVAEMLSPSLFGGRRVLVIRGG